MKKLDRRTVLGSAGMAMAGSVIAVPAMGATAYEAARRGRRTGGAAEDVLPTFPSTDPELVGAVVGAAHTDIDTVVELVTARPHLSRATVDWGFGDWESALGAASHMGRRDIAEFLIGHGARPDIFSAAMLGQLAAVRALVEAAPGVQSIPGPHGFSLLHHARVGGEAAAPVFEYLEALGDANPRPDSFDMSDERRAIFIGTYVFEAAERSSLEIAERRGVLSLKREGAPFGRNIFPVSDHEFYASGSPTVRIVFDVEGGVAAGLRVVDHEVSLSARRV